MYKLSVSKAIEQVFATPGEIIGVEGSDAVADKADASAANAFFFSLPCSLQCWRLVTFKLGTL